MARRISVLQIDSERTWRGGENQLRLLLEHAPSTDWEWHLAAPADSEVIKRLAHFAQVIPLQLRGLGLFMAARKLVAYIDAHHIQLVDCQSSRAHNLGLLVKLLRPQLKLVVHRRVDYPPHAGWLHTWKYQSPAIDRYICISAAIAAVLTSYGIAAERTRIVRSAVDPGPFKDVDRQACARALRAQWHVPADVPIIGNVAFLTEQKDHATLIRALGILKQRGQSFFCFIAGEGPLEKAARALALELGLDEGSLRFLGLRRDIPALLAGSDIFALSSRDEGLGTSLLDATHSGCALVATAVGGIPEIVLDDATGLLAAQQDAEGFAAQLQRLLRDEPLRARLVANAQAHADRWFSLSSMVAGNLAIYRELLT